MPAATATALRYHCPVLRGGFSYDAAGLREVYPPSADAPTLSAPVTLLLSADQVLLSRVQIPLKQRQRLYQAVPYALEEHLAEDVERLHFVLGERERDGGVPVAVLSHALMQALQAYLSQIGAAEARVVPELLAVPRPADGWGLLALDAYVLVRSGEFSGFVAEPDNLADLLQLALAEAAEPPTRLCWYRGPHTPALPELARHLGPVWEEQAHPQGELAWLAQSLARYKRPPLDLAQNQYRPASPYPALWRPWRLSAALALAWLAWQGFTQVHESLRLQRLGDELRAEIEQIYRATFPAGRMVDPQLQTQRHLADLQAAQGDVGGATLLELLARLHPPLTAAPQAHLKRLDYREPELDLVLELPAVQAFESLRQALQNQALQVETRNLSSRDQKVEAQLRLSLTPAGGAP